MINDVQRAHDFHGQQLFSALDTRAESIVGSCLPSFHAVRGFCIDVHAQDRPIKLTILQ